jgi:hypothetical protein
MLLIAGSLLGPREVDAQATGQTVQAVAAPAPRSEDVASEDAIIAALYGAISGPAGQKRDWVRFRSLFIPDGRLIVARPPRPDGPVPPRVMTVEQYIAGSGALEDGFFEREIKRISETFGGVTHRFSTYESRARAEDPQPLPAGSTASSCCMTDAGGGL